MEGRNDCSRVDAMNYVREESKSNVMNPATFFQPLRSTSQIINVDALLSILD